MKSGSEIRHDYRAVAGDSGLVFSGDSSSSVVCSVCLDAVADDGKRSWAKLQCGHLFHLDCIGSAFNSKGSMQCPNCRQTEKGRWLYASGSIAHSDFAVVDLSRDEDIYNLNYSEASLEALWCPPTEEFSLFSGADTLPFSNTWNHSPPAVTNADQPRSSRPQMSQPVPGSIHLTLQSPDERMGSLVDTRARNRVEAAIAAAAHSQQWPPQGRPTMWTPSSYVLPPTPYPHGIENREPLRQMFPQFPVSLRPNIEMLEASWLETEAERREWLYPY